MSKYYEDSIVERMYLKEIANELRTLFDIKYFQTPPEGKDIYDGMFYFFKKNDYKLKKRVIIEIKVRQKHYDTLMFEKKKCDDLKALRNKLDKDSKKQTGDDIKSDIWYISVTPKGTYVWNIKDKYDWIEEKHWASTNDKSKGKIMKPLTYLPISDAKKFEFTSESFKYNMRTEKQIETISLNIRRNVCIFKSLGL